MRNTRIGLGAAVATTAVAAMLLGATPAMAQDDDDLAPNRAYGIAVGGFGQVLVPPTPFVQSEDGEFVEDNLESLATIPGTAELGVFGELLHVEAEYGHAETSVVRFGLEDVFTADLIRTYCDDADGGLELINARFMGKTYATPTIAGEEIDAAPLARLRAGHQVRNDDESVTVTGIEITLFPALADGEDEDLTAEEQAQLPLLGEALGIELPSTIGNEADLRDALTESLPDLGLPGLDEDALTIIIGSATCTERGDKDEHDDKDKDEHDDKDKDKDEHGDEDKDEHDEDDDEHDAAPRPAVVDSDLAVTG